MKEILETAENIPLAVVENSLSADLVVHIPLKGVVNILSVGTVDNLEIVV